MNGSWRSFAACRGHAAAFGTHEPFYTSLEPTDTFKIRSDANIASAKLICALCPVRTPCLEEALAAPGHEDHGVWGGYSERQRRKLRRQRREAA